MRALTVGSIIAIAISRSDVAAQCAEYTFYADGGFSVRSRTPASSANKVPIARLDSVALSTRFKTELPPPTVRKTYSTRPDCQPNFRFVECSMPIIKPDTARLIPMPTANPPVRDSMPIVLHRCAPTKK